MTLGFALAAIASLATFGVHVFAGGIHVVRPLLAAGDITRASRWLNYYCWHITSLLLLTMAGGFGYAALAREGRLMAAVFAGLALALSALSAGVAVKGGVAPWRFPSTSLFLLVGLCGVWGLAG